jgi:hypothetical protein
MPTRRLSAAPTMSSSRHVQTSLMHSRPPDVSPLFKSKSLQAEMKGVRCLTANFQFVDDLTMQFQSKKECDH